ncbi:hypothetical protein EBH_0002970 [Eimeria brunetti]|uniref:Uncharacterized protein n=1 Tax=Eimeria brunetti TaxID=51314 RepID=U6LWG0_9EIME|nr:hypothetical protein EBH_0002970 [Eimeria brunetti]
MSTAWTLRAPLSEGAALEVLSPTPSLRGKQLGDGVDGGSPCSLCSKGHDSRIAVTLIAFASIFAILFLVSHCATAKRGALPRQVVRRLAGDETQEDDDGEDIVRLLCGREGSQSSTASRRRRISSDSSEPSALDGGDQSDEGPPKKKRQEMLEVLEELPPSPLYAAQSTEDSKEAEEVAKKLHESLMLYVEQIMAEDIGGLEPDDWLLGPYLEPQRLQEENPDLWLDTDESAAPEPVAGLPSAGLPDETPHLPEEQTAEETAEGAAQGTTEGIAEGTAEGTAQGVAEGTADGTTDGTAEGTAQGTAQATARGTTEGTTQSTIEGTAEDPAEGSVEGANASPDGGLVEGPNAGPDEGPDGGPDESPDEDPDESPDEDPDEGPDESPDEGTSEGTARGSSGGTAEGTAEGAAEGTAGGASGEEAAQGGELSQSSNVSSGEKSSSSEEQGSSAGAVVQKRVPQLPTQFKVEKQNQLFEFTVGRPGTKGAYRLIVSEVLSSDGMSGLTVVSVPFPTKGELQGPLQQLDFESHPYYRIPSIAPDAVIREFEFRNKIPQRRRTRCETRAMLEIKELLKRDVVDTFDLDRIMGHLEKLVIHTIQHGKDDIATMSPKYYVEKLAFALMTIDTIYAASELLGEKAKRSDWWQDVVNALPDYTGPSAIAASRITARQNVVLSRLLHSALEFYRCGRRPPAAALVPLKQAILCTPALPAFRRVPWMNYMGDDYQWQQSQ